MAAIGYAVHEALRQRQTRQAIQLSIEGAVNVKVPSKTIEVCDFCRRESSVLNECACCGRDYCTICEAIICGCVDQPQVCKQCGKNEEVVKVVLRFAKPILAVLQKRQTALKRFKL